jgi:DMSO/TMAO reductase YedYZ molybdopterin-dependent catalytic subunit
MSDRMTRRRVITTGLAAAAGVSGLAAAAHIADRYGLIPPDHQGILGAGESLTYAAQRILTSHHSLAREFSRNKISQVAPVLGDPPVIEEYQRLVPGGFADWRLTVDGLVSRPSSLSLADLRSFPVHRQITHQACEEGWSFIAEWIGVQLSYVLELVGTRPEAKYVVFTPYENDNPPRVWWESIDMADASHPQTLLAYGMNGADLPMPHGAPLRLKVPRQLGYKNTKYLYRVTVTDSVAKIGKGLGGSFPEDGYSWYAGI